MSVLQVREADRHLELLIDDGKVNAFSQALLEALVAEMQRAAAARRPVLLRGREGCFSAGYNLKVMQEGGEPRRQLRAAGDQLKLCLLEHPAPVVIACTGHALAKGALLLLCADYRLGSAGDFRIGLNETAIGINLPGSAMTLARHCLASNWQVRSTLNAELWSPDQALQAGFLDQLCAADDLLAEAQQTMRRLTALDADAYAQTKGLLRQELVQALKQAIAADA